MELTKYELATLLNVPKSKLLLSNEDNSLHVACSVIIPKELIKDGKLIIKFASVAGSFKCSNLGLTSLEGCPQTVIYDFDCSNNNITSLEGCPQNVMGIFNCSGNKLSSLHYCPVNIIGTFNCSNNELISLNYRPREISYKFDCSYNKIESLDILIECKKLIVHNNKITHISDDINISDISLYKNPYHYFKKYNYVNN